MSRMEIYAFNEDGDAQHYGDAQNSWGGAMLIWQELSDKYGYEMPLISDSMPIWAACNRGELSERDSIVCAFTFDRCWVKNDNIPRLAESLESFAREHIDGTGKVDTVRQAAEIMRLAHADPGITGIAFNQTSVCEPFWLKFDEDTEYFAPYNLHHGDDHWELFDEFPREPGDIVEGSSR